VLKNIKMVSSKELGAIIDALQKSEKTLQAIYESTKSIRFLVVPDHTVLFFNKKALEQCFSLFGIEIKTGVNISDYLKDNIITEDFDIHFEKSLNGEHVVAENLIGTGDDKTWYKIDYHPVIIDNKTIAVSISIRNINDNKKKEFMLQEQSSLLKDIQFTQTHNVRGPVANILGLVNLLDKSELSEKNIEILELLEIATKNLDKIIRTVVHDINTSNQSMEKFESP
jgi:hypothetical protein